MSRKILVLTVLAVLLSSAVHAATQRGNVNANLTRAYAFTMPDTGAVEITLTWNQNHDDLFLVMACTSGGANPLEYSSVATQSRLVRLDAGVLGGLTCAVGVASFRRAGTFTMALSISGDGPRLIPRSRAGSLRLVELDADEAAALGLTGLEDELRALRR